jgi:hypothetical protein
MPEVDRSFLRDLKNLDKRLGVKFNDRNFVVTYERGYGEPVNIHLVRNGDGGFRQPDQRDLKIIKGGDLAEGESMDTRLKKRAYISEKMREKARKDAKENIRNMTKDNKNQLVKKFTQKLNLSKGNAAFRRVITKKKKQAL